MIHFQTIFFEFSGLDDLDYLVPRAVSMNGISNINSIIFSDAFFNKKGVEFYRPVQNISYVIDTEISGSKPWGYHLSNVIIHILACLSLFYLFITLKFNRFLSLLFTALFTVHPLFAHAVSWVPSRGDLLIGLFGILTFVFFLKYLDKRKPLYFIFHIDNAFVFGFNLSILGI